MQRSGGALVIFALFAVADIITHQALAETHVEKKILQFGGPETRMVSIGDIKTKGIPKCTLHISLKKITKQCEDTWITIKGGQKKVELEQHLFFLVVEGPDAPDALRRVLDNAIQHALEAAAIAAAATPGEFGIKTAAAFVAFKTTFAADLAVEPVLAGLRDQFRVSLDEQSTW